jgi:serine/threonine protein kinase
LSLPVPRLLQDRYRLDRVLGKGGMGAVYEARDQRLDRVVAVKIMSGRAFGQPTALRRFRREARAAARLNHPNIVAVHDFGPLEGEGAFIVMEKVEGRTLREELDGGSTLAPARAAAWFDQVLAGIEAAHALGIVHRDLKPENVIGRQDEGGALVVKVLDLGLAKLREGGSGVTSHMTAEGAIMGTFGYMSPEQLAGREVDARADVYAVAVMVVEALTGRRPGPGDARTGLTARLTPAPGAALAEVLALDQLLARGLAADLHERVDSARAFRTALIPRLQAIAP